MKYLKFFESFDYSKPYHEELQNEMIRIINTAFDLEKGDRVYNNDNHSEHKGKYGTVVSFYEKDWRKAEKPSLIGRPYIKWDGEESVENYPSSIKHSGGGMLDYNIMKVDVMDEFEKVKNEYHDIISITDKINMKEVIQDLKNEIPSEEFKSKYNLTENQYNYLLDSPEVRYAFS